MKKFFRGIGYAVLAGLVVFVAWYLLKQPTLSRDWREDLAVMPEVSISGNIAHVKNVRNFRYSGQNENEWTPGYYDAEYDLNQLKKVYFIVEPFSDFKGPAHTFLSFEFEGGKYVAVSVEARKAKGQIYHPVKGLLKQYELMYVIADENDVVKLRTNYRKDRVYMFPVRVSQDKARALFTDMLLRAEKLRHEPEFYNSIFSTCTTNLVDHVNKITPKKIPFSYKYLLPAYSDELAFDLGIIDTDLPLEQAKVKYQINERAEKYSADSEFSRRIREP